MEYWWVKWKPVPYRDHDDIFILCMEGKSKYNCSILGSDNIFSESEFIFLERIPNYIEEKMNTME